MFLQHPRETAQRGLSNVWGHAADERPLCLQGGTGQTLLYREKATGDQVAIKLIKRPIPKVIMPNILREITVRAHRRCLAVANGRCIATGV